MSTLLGRLDADDMHHPRSLDPTKASSKTSDPLVGARSYRRCWVEVRQAFHKLRSLVIGNFHEHFKDIFGVHGSVPIKRSRSTTRFALGAILVYQLALTYRFEHELALNVQLKAFLQTA